TASSGIDSESYPTVDPNIALQGQCVIVCDAAIPYKRNPLASANQRNKKIAFSVMRSSDIGMPATRGGSPAVIIFDSILLNDGNSYDSSRCHFSPSRNGVYSLEFRIFKRYNRNDLVVALMVNGNAVLTSFADGNLANHELASNGALLRLASGDRVWLEILEGALDGGWKYSTFSGYLLYED
uniref:C1q domain-containing protein n=1 Tax=Ciona savignyi TaxID=51511 RepID=H2YGI7_CIOSA